MEQSNAAAIRQAWDIAAEDLGIRVQTADCWIESDGVRHEIVAIIPDFGGESGTAVLPVWDRFLADAAAASGFGYTVLGSGYEKYERALFVDTLSDWQWSGTGDAPKWYSGVPWSE